MSVAASDDLEMHQLDVKTAYLEGAIQETVCTSSSLLCLSHREEQGVSSAKALYGLKQAPRAWHKLLHEELEKLGFQALAADPSFYIWESPSRQGVSACLMWMTCSLHQSFCMSCGLVKKSIMDRFEARDLGEPSMFLNTTIVRDRANRSIKIGYKRMVLDLLEEYGLSNAKPRSMPLSTGTQLSKAQGEELGHRSVSL